MFLKNVELNEKTAISQQYPSIFVGNNPQIQQFTNGSLSAGTLKKLYSNIFDFFYTFKAQHYHQGYQIIKPNNTWDAFIKENKQYFRFNPKNNKLIYLHTEMDAGLKSGFQDYFPDAADKEIFDKIAAGLSRIDMKKIAHRLKEFNPATVIFLSKAFNDQDLVKLIIDLSRQNGSIVDSSLTEKYQSAPDSFYSAQLRQLSDFFSDNISGMTTYTENSIKNSLKNQKLSLINFLFLLNALETSRARQKKYKLVDNRLYLVNPTTPATDDEIEHLINSFTDVKKSFIQYISKAFFSQSNPEILKKLAAKSIAIGGGKGGVGKSLTSVNLALSYSMMGYSTAIIDIDPTSNISIILDLHSPINIINNKSQEITDLNDLDLNTFQIGKNLDILFSKQKLKQGDSIKLMNKLFLNYLTELNEKYDVLIMDMPAGNHLEDNLAFTPFIDNFLLVTNSEPGARKSGGGYLRSLLELDPDKKVIIWHNQVRPGVENSDFISSYNNISPDEEKLDNKLSDKIIDLGYIPETSYLKVTDRSNPKPQYLAMNLIRDILMTIQTESSPLKEKIKTTLSIINNPSRSKNSNKTVELIIKDLLNDQTVLNKYSNNIKLLISYYTLLLISSNNSIVKKINEFIPHRNIKGNPRDKHQQIIELLAKESHEQEMVEVILRIFQAQLKNFNFDSSVLPDENQQLSIVNDFATEVLYSGMGVLAPLGKRRAAEIFRDQSKQLLKEIGLIP